MSEVRRRLPDRRGGYTQKADIGGQTFYVSTGEYDDGSLGEIFIVAAKGGSLLRAVMDAFAISVSLGLQHGVPLEEFYDAFARTSFEPSGMVQGHPEITEASSFLDYLVRDLAIYYLDKAEAAKMPEVQDRL